VTRQRILLGILVLAGVVAVAIWAFRGKDARKAERKDRSGKTHERPGEADELEPDDPNDPDEPEAFDAAAGSGFSPDAGAGAAPTQPGAGAPPTTTAAAAAAPAGGPRVQRLHDNVLKEALRANWVTIDDSETPCPPDKIRIVYTPPSDIKQYKKGAYFQPLGPSPGESTVEVNGLLICEGYTFLYRGFEAYYRADSGRWDIFPFPVIEE
jgi:hypothetical protein